MLAKFPITIDGMACHRNNLVNRFVSLAFEPEAEAQNFFEFSFDVRDLVYVFPPPKLIWPTLCHLANCGAKAVVIWPMWPSIPSFSKLIRNFHLPNCVCNFTIIQTRFIYEKEAQRRIYADKNTTLVLEIDTKVPKPLDTGYNLATCVLRGCQFCLGGEGVD